MDGMVNISKLFSGLPSYPLPQQPQSLFGRIVEWFKQRRWHMDDYLNAMLLAHSGRTLRAMRPWHVNWEVLKRVAETQPIVFTIVSTAVRELSGMRWAIVVKKSRPGILKKAKAIEEFLQRPVPGGEGLTFAEWLKKILRDLFIYDAAAIEVIKDQTTGELIALKPVPGYQIDIVAAPETDDIDPEYPYMRVIRGQIVARYRPNELIYFKENTRTDSPYGISPLEAAITIVSIIMWADVFQLKNLTVTEVPEGILDLGNVPEHVVERFRMWWLTEVVGRPEKVVIVGGSPSGVRWIPFRSSNRDLQFRQLYDWYARILCMCFGVRPQDIGLVEGLNRAVAQELAVGGKRVSLYPRALLLKEIIDHDILEELFDVDLTDMEFKWLDLERRDFEQAARIIRTLGTMYLTINEAREMLGYSKVVGGLADCLFTQIGAMAFVYAKVPSEKEDMSNWEEAVPNQPGVWQGPPPEPTELSGFPMLSGELFAAPTEEPQQTSNNQLPSPLASLARQTRFAPLEKVITSVMMRVKQLPTQWERTLAWEKTTNKHLSLRVPVNRLTLLVDGKELTTEADYFNFMNRVAEAEQANPRMWETVWDAIAGTDARRATINAEQDIVTITLTGKRTERVLTFKTEGSETNA